MVFLEKGVLYRFKNGEKEELDKNPQFEFDFGKYIQRYEMPKPHVVSLLFGANEFQPCSYDMLEAELKKYINALDKMIASVK